MSKKGPRRQKKGKKPGKKKVAPKAGHKLAGFGKRKISLGAGRKKEDVVPSGILGFDELVEGGFERNSMVLVGGDSGTGKTIFCTQYLYPGPRQFHEPGLLLSFSEPKVMLYKQAAKFKWNLDALEKQGLFSFEMMAPQNMAEIVKEGGGRVFDLIDSLHVKRMVLDSISSYALLFESDYKRMEAMLALFSLLRGLSCTTLIILQKPMAPHGFDRTREEFLTDGVVHLYNLPISGARQRAIEAFNMRNLKTSNKVCAFEIGGQGITVFPEQQVVFQ